MNRIEWIALWLISILSLIDIPASPVLEWPREAYLPYLATVGAFKASLIFLIGRIAAKRSILRIAYVIAVSLYAIAATVNAVAYGLYGFGISRKLILIALQTTPREISGFAPELFANIGHALASWQCAAALLIIALLFVAARRIGRKTFRYIVGTLSAVGTIIFATFCIFISAGRTSHSLLFRSVKYTIATIDAQKQYQRMVNSLTDFPHPTAVKSTHRAETVVVVIGESASRNHWSAYGYQLPTTPFADSARDSLHIFTDAIGSSAATSGNMERILTFKVDDDTEGDAFNYPRLIDLFNIAGYKTFWLSNQERSGFWSNTSGVLASNADVIKYVGSENSDDALTIRYDDALIQPLREALADTADHKLIFLHLMGSHTKYSYRFPDSQARFTAARELAVTGREWLTEDAAATVADYDNSIRYTDSLLRIVVDDVARLNNKALLLHFSDHGENVYDEGLFCGRNERYVEVPFILYLNHSYRSANPAIVEKARQAVDRPLSTANVIYSLMTLTGTDYEAYDASRDVLSDSFIKRHRYVDEQLWKYDRE